MNRADALRAAVDRFTGIRDGGGRRHIDAAALQASQKLDQRRLSRGSGL